MNTTMFEKIGNAVIKYLPQILTTCAVGGAVGSVVLASKATVKAVKAVEQKEAEKQEPLTKTEIVKECWKYYIPTAITLGLTAGCSIGSQHENTKRNAAIAGLYAMSEATIEELKYRTREVVGEKKAEEIERKVDEARLEKAPIEKADIEYTGHGMARFEDGFGRRFWSSSNWIDNAVNELNEAMLNGDEYCNWNDLLYKLGLHSSEFGEYLGWNRHTDGLIKAKYTPILEQDGTPTLVLSFNITPHSNYTRWDALIDR